MDERILLVGFDAAEATALAGRLPFECVAHELLPRIAVERGQESLAGSATPQGVSP